MNLLLLSQDLMLTARTEGVARKLGMTVVTRRDLSAADWDSCRLLVVDLSLPGLDIPNVVKQAVVPVIACGPHVHEARLADARQAGCDLVVSRGQWDRDAERLCQELLENAEEK